jgi:hypothetical protein
MKPESLQALLIDRELGELPAETVELLEAWLAEHGEAGHAIPSIRRTLETTRTAIRRFPELARPEAPPPESRVIAFPTFGSRLIPLALAASVVILLGGSAWLGFRAGQETAQKARTGSAQGPATARSVNPGGPWARYALVSSPQGGLTLVRSDLNPQLPRTP